jgi:hypothetical protein
LLVLGCCALSLPQLERWNPLFAGVRSAHRTESDLADAVGQVPAGSRVFARLEWGGYLDCSLGASRRVFMDGWIELYPDDLWWEYETISSGAAGYESLLKKWDVDCVILDGRYHVRLLSDLCGSGAWERRGGTGSVAVLVRRKVANGQFASSLP